MNTIEFSFGETDGVIETCLYPYKASWYIWTWPEDKDFDKFISDLIGQDVLLVNQGGGNGHEYGEFITRDHFERDYCKHKVRKLEKCYGCRREADEEAITFEDLKSCPFCGWCNRVNSQILLTIKNKIVERHNDNILKYYIECSICGASGPLLAETEKGAILDWNFRQTSMHEKFQALKIKDK